MSKSSNSDASPSKSPIIVASIAEDDNSAKRMTRKGLPPIFDNRWFVLGAVFGAMMFLGLPLIWRCPSFTKLEKLFWSIATLVHSALIIWGFVWVMSWSWRQIQQSI